MTSQQARSTLRNLMATKSPLRSTCPPGTRIASVRRRQQRDVHAPIAYTCHKELGQSTSQQRSFSNTARTVAKKGESREDLNPTSTEYSKTGGGDASAAQSEHAFDASTTRPEQEGEDDATSSLNASPQNPEVNRTKDAEDKESGKSKSEAGGLAERTRTSTKASPRKAGAGKVSA